MANGPPNEQPAPTEDAASRNTHCYFLDLPRELRDMIYAYVSADHKLSVPNASFVVTISKGPARALLLSNQQVHDEYLEIAADRATIRVRVKNFSSYRRPTPVQLRPHLPWRLLDDIDRVKVSMSWCNAIWLSPREYRTWKHKASTLEAFNKLEDVEDEWTPSKGLVEFLYENLHDIYMLCSAVADWIIRIDLTRWSPTEGPALTSVRSALYVPTVARLRESMDYLNEESDLQVEFWLKTHASYSPSIESGHHDPNRNGLLLWHLCPTIDAGNYHDFFSEFCREMHHNEIPDGDHEIDGTCNDGAMDFLSDWYESDDEI